MKLQLMKLIRGHESLYFLNKIYKTKKTVPDSFWFLGTICFFH